MLAKGKTKNKTVDKVMFLLTFPKPQRPAEPRQKLTTARGPFEVCLGLGDFSA